MYDLNQILYKLILRLFILNYKSKREIRIRNVFNGAQVPIINYSKETDIGDRHQWAGRPVMKSYSIENIKSFKDSANVEIKPITIFVGRNSCGKSSLIRFPVVISQSMDSDAEAPVLLFGKYLDYGNYEDVVFGHSKRGIMKFAVNYRVLPSHLSSRIEKTSKFYKYLKKNYDIKLSITLGKYSKRMIVNTCNIDIDGIRCIDISRIQKEKYQIRIKDIFENSSEIIIDSKRVRFYKYIPWISVEEFLDNIVDSCMSISINDPSKVELIKKTLKERLYSQGFGMPVVAQGEAADYQEVFSWCQLVELYESLLISVRMTSMQEAEDTYYIGPFRENPSRVYRDVEHRVDSVGTRGQDVSAMLKNDYVHDKKVINGVSEWLERSMDYKLSLKDIGSGLYNIVVKKHDGTQDNLIDVGYGISQVLPIVAQLVKMRVAPKYTRYYPYNNENRCSTLIIEQPELHLHPEAQAELANLFVDAVEKNTPVNELNLLIETHSEHLIRRLQALVANKNNSITNEDVKIYYVDKNTKNEAYITEMKMLSNGQFEKEWPTGFFDKGYKLALELFDQ